MKDKSEIINAAQKFASKGNIDKAIAEWEKLLKDGKDGNVQNTIGDLYLKKGAEPQAIEAFTKAAEIFRKNGFYPKAIAIYKKIINITPNSVETLIALAKLHATRGLYGNAAENYFKAAEIYQRNGYAEKATMAVERILKLSPTDMGTREKIADWYIKADMKQRAANEYAAIAINYLEKDNTANAEKFFKIAADLDPESIPSLIGLSMLAEKTGNTELAFKHLEKALSFDQHSKDAMIAYSELAIRNNRRDDAEQTLLRLIEKNPSYDRPRKLLGDLYLNENQTEKAWEQFIPCIDAAIEAKKWDKAIELLNNFRELHPVPVRERIIEVHRAADNKVDLARELKELAPLHEEQSSKDSALKLYKEILELEPDNAEITDKIKELEPRHEIKKKDGPTAEKPMPAAGARDPKEADSISFYEALAEKRKEAEFYAKQGMNAEAAGVYEEIHKAAPNDKEIKKRLEELRSASGQSKEVVVKKLFEEEEEPFTEEDIGSTTQDLQSIFDKFKKDDDYDARYKAGMEYKRKGLLDDAIKEFKIAAEDPEKRLVSTSMIALCYMDKGDYANAIRKFSSILESMSSDDANYLRIKYELAGARMKNEENDEALKLYSEIKERAPEFKGIDKKINSLQSLTQKTEEDKKKTKSKKSRVSYI